MKIVCPKSLTMLLVLGFAGEIGNMHAQIEAQTAVNVVIDTQSPGARIPDDFAGLSFETETLLPDKTGTGHDPGLDTAPDCAAPNDIGRRTQILDPAVGT